MTLHLPPVLVAYYITTRRADYNVGTLRETSMSLFTSLGSPNLLHCLLNPRDQVKQVAFSNAYADGCHRPPCPSPLFPFHPVNWNHPSQSWVTPGPSSHDPRDIGFWVELETRDSLSPGYKRENSPEMSLDIRDPPCVGPWPVPGPILWCNPPLFCRSLDYART